MQQYTRITSVLCLNFATYNICDSLFFVWWFYRRSLLKSCGSKLYTWKIQWSITIPPFHIFCVPVLCWCVLDTPDFNSSDMTRYILDSTAGAWSHNVKFTLPVYPGTHTWVFPSVRVVLNVTFVPGFVMFVD